MSSFQHIRDEFITREIERLPECPALDTEAAHRITRTVFVPSKPARADLIFVFGCSRTQGWPLVAKLYHEKFAPTILVTGGLNKGGQIQSHIIREALIAQGVSPDDIVVEEKSTNTLEDAKFGREIIEARGLPHQLILFAATSTHSGRRLRTLQKIFPYSGCYPFVYDYVDDAGTVINAFNWTESEAGRRRVWGEYLRIQRYSERGDIA